ncbi:hypothetical protein DWW90_12095 [Parabacteroides sp. AF17-28]|nr:hypothetical protein DWW90_12095 [Parabacteroides sp. AF17-28]
MIKRIGKFLLVISSIKKRPLCEERLLFCYKASAFFHVFIFLYILNAKYNNPLFGHFSISSEILIDFELTLFALLAFTDDNR